VSLRDLWDANAEAWIRWARAPGHDSYPQFHGRVFSELLPPPGRLTVDVGAGEGRVGRDLVALGHTVVALDASPTLARAGATHDVPLPAIVADAAALPLTSGCADLVVAFMCLQDVDDLSGAVMEAARLLGPGGRLCVAIVHPLNSAGRFEGERNEMAAPFTIRGSYLSTFRYHDDVERDGLVMSFHSLHRPLEAYSAALEGAGLVIEALREVTVPDPDDRWSRIPLFLHLRARRSTDGPG
jgi:SAM-dependent methyltransferase